MSDQPTGKPRRGVRRGIYVLPALFTVGSIFCGFLSLDFALKASFDTAAILIFVAGVLDGLDGRVARMTRTTSAFGEQLDSLADVVSFGVAPSFLVYRWGLAEFDRLGLAVSFLFLVCGACRLARFNVQVHVVDKRHFVGLPIPAAAGTLAALIWLFADSPPREIKAAFLFVTAILAFLMVSTFRYRSFKDVDLRSRRSTLLVPLVAVVLGLFVWWQPKWAFSLLGVGYALSAPVTRLVGLLRPSPAAKAEPQLAKAPPKATG